jgi:hypothetical protein
VGEKLIKESDFAQLADTRWNAFNRFTPNARTGRKNEARHVQTKLPHPY